MSWINYSCSRVIDFVKYLLQLILGRCQPKIIKSSHQGKQNTWREFMTLNQLWSAAYAHINGATNVLHSFVNPWGYLHIGCVKIMTRKLSSLNKFHNRSYPNTITASHLRMFITDYVFIFQFSTKYEENTKWL